MGLFSGQFANVVEWEEYREDLLFWKWNNKEIKKGSRLILRAGQDAIFMYNGKREGIFKEEGNYDIESQIIPFLSTLKGFKFGFNSGLRAEVLFINTKEFTLKWGTKGPINIPHPSLVGGIPVRALGTFNCKISDYITFIDKIAGVKQQYSIDEVKERVLSILNQLLMKWISKEGKDMFHLQANAYEISQGIRTDLDMELMKIGLSVTGFQVDSFNYPEEIQDMITKVASQGMIGDMGRYQQVSMLDAMSKGGANGMGNIAGDMAGMQMGMMMGQQMVQQMQANQQMNNQMQTNQQMNPQMQQGAVAGNGAEGTGNIPNFCPNCGQKTSGSKFCPNCGYKLV